MSEEAATLVKDRTGLTVEAEVGRSIKKKMIGGMQEKEIFVSTGHRVLTVRPCHSAHDDQPRLLHNNIVFLSKTIFLRGSKSYRLVRTFVRSHH